MKLKILKDHDHEHTPARVTAYKAGQEVNVPPKVGTALLAIDGVAERVTKTQNQPTETES